MMVNFPFDAVIFACEGLLVASEGLVDDVEARLQPVLGVSEALGLLTGRGIPVCAVSHGPSARVDLCSRTTDLVRYFEDRVFTAALVPRAKPCPDLFLFAAARMGVEPVRCAVIEDSPSGAVAAVAAGMKVFGYAADADAKALWAAGVTAFDEMAQLPSLLERGRGRCADSAAWEEDGLRLRDVYTRLFAGDPRPFVDFLAEDAVYHLPGGHLGGGTLRGRREILERSALGARSCDGPPSMHLTRVVASRGTLLSLERFTARRRRRVLDQEVCVVWRMVAGRCVEMWSRFSDQRACDQFWAEA